MCFLTKLKHYWNMKNTITHQLWKHCSIIIVLVVPLYFTAISLCAVYNPCFTMRLLLNLLGFLSALSQVTKRILVILGQILRVKEEAQQHRGQRPFIILVNKTHTLQKEKAHTSWRWPLPLGWPSFALQFSRGLSLTYPVLPTWLG